MGMVTLYTGFLALFTDFGIGAAIIVDQGMSPNQIRQLNTIAAGSGVCYFGISCLFAPLIASFFRTPALEKAIYAMATTFIIVAFSAVPDALLTKEMRFRSIAMIEAARVIASVSVTLSLAVLGWRYWALAIGAIVGTAAASFPRMFLMKTGFAKPDFKSLRPALRFGFHQVGARVGSYGYSNSDFLVAGRVLGQIPMGIYTMAWDLANLPVQKMAAVIVQVTPPVFSALQSDLPRLRNYFMGFTRHLATLIFPVATGLAIVADDFVTLVLGEKWHAAIRPLQLLCLYAAVRSLTTFLPPILNVLGGSRFVMVLHILAACVFPLAFLGASRWGPTGIAAAWLFMYPLVYVPMYRRTLRHLNVKVTELFRALTPVLGACAALLGTALLAAWIGGSGTSWLRLGLKVGGGALGFIAGMYILDRGYVGEIRAAVQKFQSAA
jgi:teichuronic acid exporter